MISQARHKLIRKEAQPMGLSVKSMEDLVFEVLRQLQVARKSYIPRGVCSEKIYYSIEDGKVKNVEFIKGCNGNLKGIARLIEGMEVNEVIGRLKGIDCNGKGTSCPDQLACALECEQQKN